MESSLSDLCFQSFLKHSALSADVWSALFLSRLTWRKRGRGFVKDTWRIRSQKCLFFSAKC